MLCDELCDELEDSRVEEQDDDEVAARECGVVGVVIVGSGGTRDVDTSADLVSNDSGEVMWEEVDARDDLDIDDKDPN